MVVCRTTIFHITQDIHTHIDMADEHYDRNQQHGQNYGNKLWEVWVFCKYVYLTSSSCWHMPGMCICIHLFMRVYTHTHLLLQACVDRCQVFVHEIYLKLLSNHVKCTLNLLISPEISSEKMSIVTLLMIITAEVLFTLFF